ncbi:response regulator transcription factor [Vibrio cholerae]|uniref:response regulator transcription factor n=11 Tax=Vibrio cholerae TaxID=666 RepID=UPI000DBE1DAC|nr:response regulator transcription factor [Vibrio cholerae]EGQ7701857.1 response regulator transcription factor [Vibrio cholerae]EGR2508358.1 response regulator transcription factor [Vibrio cholerae]EHB5526943.1 response regulator transcription factor [Vibrio cholerae]EHE6946259.1 response regulator transcription factor [Vibrio cholerae]EHU0381756.1 response regulator transcription factor [Vibrio cholerae]
MSTEQSFFIDSINKLWNNKDWIFSGIGVFLLSSLFVFFKRRKMHDIQSSPSQTIINFSNTNENYQKIEKSPENENKNSHNKTEEYYKNNTKILIVDDEIKFKLPKIFKASGWVHSKLIKDIDNLDHIDVKEADILFIDVQGVGVSLGFKDEGLGLVEAIKEKYPSKKVIIYSVVSQGDRFHNAFNVCDGQLSKDADPYQFQRILEKFAFSELYND